MRALLVVALAWARGVSVDRLCRAAATGPGGTVVGNDEHALRDRALGVPDRLRVRSR